MTCRETQAALAAYVDGELGGAERLRVSAHLAQCVECASEDAALRDLGDMLRGSVAPVPPPDVLAGLASGVVSRISAEDRQSWRSRLGVLFEDWHWLAVGSGACSGAFVSALLVFAMLYSPTTQARQLNEKVGTLYIMTLPEGGIGQPNVLEVGGDFQAPKILQRYALPASFGWLGEQELVSQLDRSLMRNGRYVRFDELSMVDREEISNLLREIARLRQASISRRPFGQANVSGMHLRIDEVVTATGL